MAIWFLAAKQAKSSADVLNKLKEVDLSSTGETRAFAEELFSRVPRKAATVNVRLFLILILFWLSINSGFVCVLVCKFYLLGEFYCY